MERKELHCDACGATLTLAEGALSATCPFCASNKVAVRAASGDQLRPRVLIPFKIKPDDLRSRVSKWLGQGWYHPEGLAEDESKILSIRGYRAKTIQVFSGSFDFMAMTQGARGVHQCRDVLWMFCGSFDEQIHRRSVTICHP